MVQCPPKSLAIEYAGKHRAKFLARIPADHTLEDVLAPEYFGDLISANGFREGDLIEVEWEDFSRYAELQVRAVEASLRIVTTAVRGAVNEYEVGDLPDGWTMEFLSPADGWVIINNGQHVEAGFPTSDRARNRVAFLASRVVERDRVLHAATRRPPRKTQAA